VDTASRSAFLARHALLAYLVLAYGFSWIILVPAGLAFQAGMLGDDSGPVGLLALLAPFGPALAAFVVSAAIGGRAAVGELLRRLVQWQVGIGWYLLVLLGVPVVELLGAFVVIGRVPVEDLVENLPVILGRYLPNLLAVTVLTGLAEEPGWRGFALPRLQVQPGPLVGTAILGVVWAGWHLPNLLFGGWTVESYGLWFVATVASAFLYTWVYNHVAGSLLVMMLLHATINTGAGLTTWLIPGFAATDRTPLYAATAISMGVVAIVLVMFTRGRLGFRASDDEPVPGSL
jgi:membrane protease YdiL (CAAX protease family)